ncbi:MAG: HAD family phosphatase [Anaerolineaceae bacterium]|nr:HAD family phosphatase [Anaerolineaceae bacterium]
MNNQNPIIDISHHAILWDMDGVIVNNGDFHYQAWVKTMQKLGALFTREQFNATFGMNNQGLLSTIFKDHLSDQEIIRIGEEKEQIFLELVAGNAVLLPGVLDWLNRFQSWGFKQAIASSAPQGNIDHHISELGIRQYFDAVVSGALLPGKPAPDVFLEAARILGVEIEDCIVIEDAIPGVQAAKNAGMKCIAVLTTNNAENLMQADLVVENLEYLKIEQFSSLTG